MKNIEDILEISKIKDNLNKYTKTYLGKKKIELLKASNNYNEILNSYYLLGEMIDIHNKFGEVPLKSDLDMYDEINWARKGNIFDETKLNMIKEEIQNTVDVIKFSMWIDYDSKYLANLFTKLSADELLYSEINNAIGLDNRVKDSASRELAQIRKAIEHINRDIYAALSGIVSKYKDRLNGDNFVMKNGRYTIPIRSGDKNNLDGILQDVSDSGQTAFIEPKEVLELENKKYALELKEKDEITKILTNLTNIVIDHSNKLIENNETLSELDFISAKAKYAYEIDAVIPNITKEFNLSLIDARHPLIDKNVCVPNSFKLKQKDKNLMIISGPNAGGKTIALKTVSLLCYMVKMGLAIPCLSDSVVPIFDNIYVEIGDSQSIESNLSTFSGHISSLSVVFQYISSRDLVVIDELCSGTDPHEGECLAVAISKFLISTGCISLITSHYPLLKKFALTNEHIMNASFLFNEKSITPTFKMLLGVSGKSYGFLISKKYGLNQEIIDDAKRIYDKSFETENDKKISRLDEKERYLIQKEQKLKSRQDSLANLRNDLTNKEKELREKENKLKNQKIDKFDVFLNDKYNEVLNIYEDFMKTKDLKKAEEKLDKINIKKKKNEEIKIGDYVEIKSLGIKGSISRITNDKVVITSEDGFSFTAKKELCEIIEAPKRQLKATINVDKYIANQKEVSHSLNLVGYHIDEGISTLDKYLDDCVLAGYKSVKIIHGYGSGQLKKAIHEYLKTKKNVASFRLGSEIDGGTGATIVELK